eukprot:TRINITY_DN113111_c0_g1_i1.p1 TRINITY_DN113111_c0_g1~~TRINITY_DN113111_c0_g1_i1.p1  ORF type:complete len:600 (-),score=162.08 TRINITY_DN113111_c0_g1_i1:32-1831(-)
MSPQQQRSTAAGCRPIFGQGSRPTMQRRVQRAAPLAVVLVVAIAGRLLAICRSAAFLEVSPRPGKSVSAGFLASGQSALSSTQDRWHRAGQPRTTRHSTTDIVEEPKTQLRVDELRLGQRLTGVVTSLAKFGAFVDVGAERPGLVPNEKLMQGYCDWAGDVVHIGQNVTVWVCDASFEKFSLSMMPDRIWSNGQRPEPREGQADARLFEGLRNETWLQGKVKAVQPYGVFVEVDPPALDGQESSQARGLGLVHRSELVDGFGKFTSEQVKVGQEVDVRVISVDADNNRLALSMRPRQRGSQSMEDVSAFEGHEGWLTGMVSSITKYGAFVDVEPPGGGVAARGLVHITQLKDGFVKDVNDEVVLGEEVKVRVVSVDTSKGRLLLSMKDPSAAAAAKAPSVDLSPFQEIETFMPGKVVGISAYGAFVDVDSPAGGPPARGLLHISQIAFQTDAQDASEELSVGDEVQVRVLQVDLAKKRMALTMLDKDASTAKAPNLEAFDGHQGWLDGTVSKILNIGALVDVQPPNGGEAATGLVYISQLSNEFVKDTQDEVEVGQKVKVRVVSVANGKLDLSMIEEKKSAGTADGDSETAAAAEQPEA